MATMEDHESKISVTVTGEHKENAPYDEFAISPQEERKLIREADWRLLPCLTLLYALSFIDRTSISNARIVGMTEDLNLYGNRYNIVLMVFFITYTLFEIPSNTIIRRVGVSRYLTSLIICWGVVAMCFGFVNTFGQMCGLRVLLGLFESGFNPAALYLISSWYKRYEVQKRVAFWFIGGAFMSGFNGIICYGLSQMEGVGGVRGWRWIFIIPGIVTIILAVPFYIFVSDFPEKAKWLNSTQRAFMQRRLFEDRGEELEKLQRKHLIEACKDWKVWMMGSLMGFPTAGGYTMAFFAPSILRGLGYSIAASQCLATPPYVAAAICSVAIAWWADKIKRRAPFIIGLCLLVIVGFLLIGWGPNNGSRLVGIFFGVIGNFCAIPTAIAFLMNNTPGAAKRQIAIPIQTTMGGIGGVIGAVVFRAQDAPTFRPGLYASFACMTITISFTLFLVFTFKRENRRADEEGKVLEGVEGFRYTL